MPSHSISFLGGRVSSKVRLLCCHIKVVCGECVVQGAALII